MNGTNAGVPAERAGPNNGADRFRALLPAIYREDPLLARFLRPFQRILLGGADEDGRLGFEEMLDRLNELFEPERTPERFLPWLARWAGLDLPEGLDILDQRRLVAEAVNLRRLRGTREGLERILDLATGGRASVAEPSAPDLQIGVHSTVGVDTVVEGPMPGFFHVDLAAAGSTGADEAGMNVQARRLEALARQIIELEKPAHTWYTLTMSLSGKYPGERQPTSP